MKVSVSPTVGPLPERSIDSVWKPYSVAGVKFVSVRLCCVTSLDSPVLKSRLPPAGPKLTALSESSSVSQVIKADLSLGVKVTFWITGFVISGDESVMNSSIVLCVGPLLFWSFEAAWM